MSSEINELGSPVYRALTEFANNIIRLFQLIILDPRIWLGLSVGLTLGSYELLQHASVWLDKLGTSWFQDLPTEHSSPSEEPFDVGSVQFHLPAPSSGAYIAEYKRAGVVVVKPLGGSSDNDTTTVSVAGQ